MSIDVITKWQHDNKFLNKTLLQCFPPSASRPLHFVTFGFIKSKNLFYQRKKKFGFFCYFVKVAIRKELKIFV